jgi:hypothetical protein
MVNAAVCHGAALDGHAIQPDTLNVLGGVMSRRWARIQSFVFDGKGALRRGPFLAGAKPLGHAGASLDKDLDCWLRSC